MDEHGCQKVAFGSRRLAHRVRTGLASGSRRRLRAYFCPACNRWHLTSQARADHDLATRQRYRRTKFVYCEAS